VKSNGSRGLSVPGALALVGPGRVGTALAVLAERAGWRVGAVLIHSPGDRERAERYLASCEISDDPKALRGADLVLVATPDDAIAPVVLRLAASGVFAPGQRVVHTSGAAGRWVLSEAEAAGAATLAVHPVQTCPSVEAAVERLAGAAYGVTCADSEWRFARQFVSSLGGRAFRLSEQDRPIYHAALALTSNSLVTLAVQAGRMLAGCGVKRPFEVLAPLLSATVDNVRDLEDAALTGPVARGDAGTISRHLEALAGTAPEVLPVYVELAKLTARRAAESGLLGADKAGEIVALLDDWSSRRG